MPVAGTAWPRVRAGLITLVLAVGFVAGWPLMSDASLSRIGEPWTTATHVLREVQAILLAPFRPIMNALVVSERWSLFSGASTERSRIRLEAREQQSGRWVVLYRPHDPQHREGARVFEYRRVRGAWNPRRSGPQPGYETFVAFAARRIMAEHPEFSAVRASLEAIVILPEGQGFRGTGRVSHTVVRTRAEVFP